MARKPTPPSPLPDSFDPVEIALDADRGDPAPDSPARALLLKHNALADADLRHRRLQIASERAGLALKVLTGAAGLAAAAVLGVMAWDAHNAKGLVMEPFSTPPDMAAKGYGGQAVAARFLDRLRDLQAKTDSARAPSSYGNDWASSFKVEIPGSGISIEELQRFLRGWLGHETHVSGELTRSATGLQLSVRAGDEVGHIYSAPGEDLDGLMQQAALDLYKQQQPYRYAIYLLRNGKLDEGEAALRALGYDGPFEEQAFALAGLANTLCFDRHDCRAALAVARHALEVDPKAIKPLWNVRDAQAQLDQREAHLQTIRVIQARGRDPKVTDAAYDQATAGDQALRLEILGDFAGAAAASELGARLPDYNSNRLAATYSWISDSLKAHDFPRHSALLALYTPGFPRPELLTYLPFERAIVLEDWATVAQARWLEVATIPNAPMPAVVAQSLAARARAHLGDFAGAEALVGAMAGDCYSCLIARGDIAAMKGETAASDHWFDEAVRQGPSIPEGYLVWGRAKLARGDTAGAIALFARAVAKGPRYADPVCAWAEALLRQGDAKGAETKLRRTLILAPHWGRAHALLGEALMKQGRPDAASAEWSIALNSDLTAGERARVAYWIKGGR